MLSKESVNRLIAESDEEEKEMILNCLDSFENYHTAVYRLEQKKMLGSSLFQSSEEYQTAITEADRQRTRLHNSLISYVRILNRMCDNHGIAPFYDGIVSEERPYRREVANAVFEYLDSIIKARS